MQADTAAYLREVEGPKRALTLVDAVPYAPQDSELPADDNWWDRAACLGADNEAFFPERGGSTYEAKKLCKICPVKDECLEYALGNDETWGVWGGTSEKERRKLKRAAVAA